MAAPYQTLEVTHLNDIAIVRPRRSSLDETWIARFGAELQGLIEDDGCRRMILSLDGVHCLYSNLMAKLIAVHKTITQYGGRIKLVEVPPVGQEAFRVCKLDHHFEFDPDVEAALANW